jgi:hypothetical protein
VTDATLAALRKYNDERIADWFGPALENYNRILRMQVAIIGMSSYTWIGTLSPWGLYLQYLNFD